MAEEKIIVMDNAELALNSPMVAVPATMYAKQQIEFPASVAERRAFFGEEINFLAQPKSDISAGRGSTFIQADTVPCPYILRGLGIILKVEPMGFSLDGEAMVTPEAEVDTPDFTGVVAHGGTPRPATFEFGSPSWRFAQAFLQAYRLDFTVGCRYNLIDELAADVGYIGADNGFAGFGDQLTPTTECIRSSNDRYRDVGANYIFVPQTTQAGSPNTAVPPPMASASFGGPQLGGLFGGMYTLKKPLVLMPGMPIRTALRRDPGDRYYYARMMREVQGGMSSATAATMAAVTYDANLNEDIAGDLGYASSVVFKNCLVTVGFVFKGWEATPGACVDFLSDFVLGEGFLQGASKTPREPKLNDLYTMYGGNNMLAWARQHRPAGRLAGLGALPIVGQLALARRETTGLPLRHRRRPVRLTTGGASERRVRQPFLRGLPMDPVILSPQQAALGARDPAALYAWLKTPSQPFVQPVEVTFESTTPNVPQETQFLRCGSDFLITDIVYDVFRPDFMDGNVFKAESDLANSKMPSIKTRWKVVGGVTPYYLGIQDVNVQQIARHSTSYGPPDWFCGWYINGLQTVVPEFYVTRELGETEVPYILSMSLKGQILACMNYGGVSNDRALVLLREEFGVVLASGYLAARK